MTRRRELGAPPSACPSDATWSALSSIEEPTRAPDSNRTRSAPATLRPPAPRADEGSLAYVLTTGETVGRYHVRRLLGEGGMGRVYLARDVILGRSIALKIVRRDVFDVGAGARFIEEARAVASLNHPHVVQLYDVGEHRGSLYLALEYIEGETLQQRTAHEAPGVDSALRVGRAIADALAHAHAHGIYHCDLKPSNVILGRDGRLRVVDFGLARTATTSAGGRFEGTPDWMAPEQWACLPPSDRVDVWALGLIMTRLLTGLHPFGDDPVERRRAVVDPTTVPRRIARRDVSPLLSQLIARSLEREPSARPTAREWREALDQLLEVRAGPPPEIAPFRGLAPFDERHTSFFFGRERETDSFLEQLRTSPLLPIVGPSGAGKSSFLYAGVIARLRTREPTTILSFRPGPDPIGALARSLLTGDVRALGATLPAPSQDEVSAFAQDLCETPTLVAARLATIAATQRTTVVVAVDQLEELFTQGASEIDVRRFLELLFACVDDPRDPVRVIVTLRDDFLVRVPDLRTLFVLRGLRGDDLRQAVAGPLHRCGYRFDDEALLNDMLAEIGSEQPADLPLLQFACQTLWDERDRERSLLLRATYERIGGVAGALARHADSVLAQMPLPERHLLPKLFLRLVAGTARRAVERTRLLAGLPSVATHALDRLLAARLFTQRIAPGGEGVLLEIAHESLLRSWSQLARWLDESREERRLLTELQEATTYWERRARRPEETWPAADLLAVRRQVARLGLELPPPVERFLAVGEQYQRQQQRRGRRRRAAVAGLSGVATVAALGVVTNLQLAKSNLGQVDFVLLPFDWVDGQTRPVSLAELPQLSWRLYGPSPGDEHRPGAPVPRELVRVTRLAGSVQPAERVEAPGGMAFLRVDGRGRAGEACSPSWIRLQNLPGYTTRGAPPPVWRLELPTCQASASGTVTIEAGPFLYGGPGEPPTRFADYVEPEREVDLGAYAIDRTEVSNAQFQPFARLTAITGYAIPVYPSNDVHAQDGAPDRPVTAIDAFEAEAFCRYLGKHLPSDFEWTKAARGGLLLGGVPNPAPRRLFPWGNRPEASCANAEGVGDGSRWLASVNAFGCGASPYGESYGVATQARPQSSSTPPRYFETPARAGTLTSPSAFAAPPSQTSPAAGQASQSLD